MLFPFCSLQNTNTVLNTTAFNFTKIRHALRDTARLEEKIELDQLLNALDWTLRDLIKNLSVDCLNVFDVCEWRGKLVDCKKYVKKTLTTDGYCCSFNTPASRTSRFLELKTALNSY